jgi:hypothetical protein
VRHEPAIRQAENVNINPQIFSNFVGKLNKFSTGIPFFWLKIILKNIEKKLNLN